MYDFIRRWAEIAPERTAIEEVRSGRTWTFGRLNSRSESVAGAWRAGFERGSRVAILTEGRGEVFEALFAATKSKTILVPLNWRLAEAELQGILEDAGADVLVYDGAHAQLAESLLAQARKGRTVQGVALDEPVSSEHRRWDVLAEGGRQAPSPFELELEDVPLILYTSGTTGTPKGVMIPWRQIVFNAINTVLAADVSSSDATLACLPLFHTGGLHALATPTLYRGGRVLLSPSFDPKEATELLSSGRATTTIAVPTMYEMMVGAGLLESKTSVQPRALLCGGAPITHSMLERFHEAGAPLRQGFGLTEVGPNCFTLSPLEGPDRMGSVGHPAFHGQARLVDEHGGLVDDGTPGELHLKGPHVCRGYWNRPEATQAVMDDEGWFRTGDLLVRNQRGVYSVVGRLKDMFISGGENVYPAEIESALTEHPDIESAAVVGVSDPKWGQVGCGVLIPRSEAGPPSPEALRDWLKARLARYKVPKHWRFVDSYPLNAAGKVEKTRLQATAEQELRADPGAEEVDA